MSWGERGEGSAFLHLIRYVVTLDTTFMYSAFPLHSFFTSLYFRGLVGWERDQSQLAKQTDRQTDRQMDGQIISIA
jgi:hypothetical protein